MRWRNWIAAVAMALVLAVAVVTLVMGRAGLAAVIVAGALTIGVVALRESER